MRVNRGAYVVTFLLAGVIAAGVFVFAQPRAEIVRARVDIPVLTQISADMVETVTVSPADAPANAAGSIDEVVGRYAALPILAGQTVDQRALERTPGERALGFGAALPAGQVAFALPVEPSQAVGAALAPGARVDVIAVPNALRTSSGAPSESSPPAAEVLGQGYLILALRTGDGQPLTSGPADGGDASAALVPPKLGSVVIAIPADRAAEFATAALTSTFYLTLTQPATNE
jgi:Flp pilus assembly protein CpaB